MVNEKEMVLDGFKFLSRKEFERAMKEKETIEYIVANTNMSDMRSVLKVYNKAIDKKSFQTVIGLEFVNNMRKKLVASGVVSEKTLSYVLVMQKMPDAQKVPAMSKSEAERKAEKYKKAYENEAAGRKIRNMAILFLTVLLAALVIITVKSKYSVFTYFTDYKSDMENELIDKYEKWEQTLEDKQKALDKREKELKDRQESSENDNSK